MNTPQKPSDIGTPSMRAAVLTRLRRAGLKFADDGYKKYSDDGRKTLMSLLYALQDALLEVECAADWDTHLGLSDCVIELADKIETVEALCSPKDADA